MPPLSVSLIFSRKDFDAITATDFTHCNAQYSIAAELAGKLALYLLPHVLDFIIANKTIDKITQKVYNYQAIIEEKYVYQGERICMPTKVIHCKAYPPFRPFI